MEAVTAVQQPAAKLLDATPLLDDPASLRRLAQEEGYVFLPGLIGEQEIAAARAAILEVCVRHGLCSHDSRPGELPRATGVRLIEGQSEAWFDYYADLLRLRRLYALAWSPRLLAAVRAILECDVLPHPCSIFRVIGPGVEEFTKPAHQDVRYVGAGARIWTAWIACADCPDEIGGLSVLGRSHAKGELPVVQQAWGKEAVWPAGLLWERRPMQTGDGILFSSLTVHRGVPNRSAEGLRISVDFRYQPTSDPFRPEALLPHLRFLAWDDVYRDWSQDDPLKYYWRRKELQLDCR